MNGWLDELMNERHDDDDDNNNGNISMNRDLSQWIILLATGYRDFFTGDKVAGEESC